MKFLPWLKQDYQPNFHLLHFACYWYSAVACLSWKSPGYLVGQRRGVEDAKSTATCSLIMTNYNKWKIEGSWTYLEGHTSTFFLWWREVTCVAWYSPSPGWTPPLQATRRSPGYKGPIPLRKQFKNLLQHILPNSGVWTFTHMFLVVGTPSLHYLKLLNFLLW